MNTLRTVDFPSIKGRAHAVAAALALAASGLTAAQASAAAAPVPAGKVQHTVTQSVESSDSVPAGTSAYDTVSESWTGAKASRTVITNARTGALVYECGSSGPDWRCYYPEGNILEQGSGNDPLAGASWEQEGAFWAKWRGDGWASKRTGVTLGRPVTVYAYQGKNVEDGSALTSTYDVDDETGFVLKQVVRATSPAHAGHPAEAVEETQTVTTFEVLDASSVNLRMTTHPGAKARVVRSSRTPALSKADKAKQTAPKHAKKMAKRTKKLARR